MTATCLACNHKFTVALRVLAPARFEVRCPNCGARWRLDVTFTRLVDEVSTGG